MESDTFVVVRREYYSMEMLKARRFPAKGMFNCLELAFSQNLFPHEKDRKYTI